ncbi:uncharacterized protein LOC143038746 [Oratosquilla oratoria]|uniref:uncharacterized protein LOC143038746 n=1 Tax=Oratosquilla oratoria TaxID=337810 RepID=UPI003F77197C
MGSPTEAATTAAFAAQPEILLATELKLQLKSYTDTFFDSYRNASSKLQKLLPDESGDLDVEYPHRRRVRRRGPTNLQRLHNGYASLFSSESRNRNKKKKKTGGKDADMPIVLVPDEVPTDCVASNQLSSFGFLGFILNILNAVINVANNINNNLNSNNDNNNNNNQNDGNVNIVESTNTASNRALRAMLGSRLNHLRDMRASVDRHIQRIAGYKQPKRRSISPCFSPSLSTSSPSSSFSSFSPTSPPLSSSPASSSSSSSSFSYSASSSLFCDENGDHHIVDEALLAAIALLDLWKEVLFEDDPFCMALEICETSSKLTKYSRIAAEMGKVAVIAASNMLLNFQGVHPAFLIHASDQGANGVNCSQAFQQCSVDTV